jgi:hypothetical protein
MNGERYRDKTEKEDCKSVIGCRIVWRLDFGCAAVSYYTLVVYFKKPLIRQESNMTLSFVYGGDIKI